jgi:hypothetical protein
MRPFPDARERIARADFHFKAGAALWDRFLEDEPYGVSLNIEDDGSGEIFISPRYDPLPSNWSIEFGEMLYQLRAALDSLVYQAAINDSGQDPPPDQHRLEFPFRETPDEFGRAAWKIGPLADARRSIIESVQPYQAAGAADDDRATITALATLNRWAAIDRHRRLHVIGSWATRAEPQFRLPEGVTLRRVEVVPGAGQFLEDDSVVARFVLDGWQPRLPLQANPNLFIDITVAEAGPMGENPTLEDASNRLMQSVQVVLKRFENSY